MAPKLWSRNDTEPKGDEGKGAEALGDAGTHSSGWLRREESRAGQAGCHTGVAFPSALLKALGTDLASPPTL